MMGVDVTKAEIVDALGRAWGRWDELAGQIPRDRMTESGMTGDWSYKDVLAHLMAYERYIAALVRSTATGNEPTSMDLFGTPESPDYSSITTEHDQNALIYDLYRDWTLTEAENEALRVRKHLLGAIELLPENQLNAPAPWTHGEDIWQRIASETYSHREEHIAALQERLNGSQ